MDTDNFSILDTDFVSIYARNIGRSQRKYMFAALRFVSTFWMCTNTLMGYFYSHSAWNEWPDKIPTRELHLENLFKIGNEDRNTMKRSASRVRHFLTPNTLLIPDFVEYLAIFLWSIFHEKYLKNHRFYRILGHFLTYFFLRKTPKEFPTSSNIRPFFYSKRLTNHRFRRIFAHAPPRTINCTGRCPTQ